jgi:hypothetical protein
VLVMPTLDGSSAPLLHDVNAWANLDPNSAPPRLSYPVFISKPSTHHMHDPGSIVPHIRPKVFTDNQKS